MCVCACFTGILHLANWPMVTADGCKQKIVQTIPYDHRKSTVEMQDGSMSSFAGTNHRFRKWILVLGPWDASPGCGARGNLRNGSSHWILVMGPRNAPSGCGTRENLRNGSSHWILVLGPRNASLGCGTRENLRNGSLHYIAGLDLRRAGCGEIFVADPCHGSSVQALGIRSSTWVLAMCRRNAVSVPGHGARGNLRKHSS